MIKRFILITVAAAVLLPAATAGATAPSLSYKGKTKEGTKITFILGSGWIKNLQTLLPTTCISVQGGTPQVDLTMWSIPFNFRLGTTAKVDYGDPTRHYTITTRRQGSRIVGKLSMNYSLLGSDNAGGYKIWHCLATGNFDLLPHANPREPKRWALLHAHPRSGDARVSGEPA